MAGRLFVRTGGRGSAGAGPAQPGADELARLAAALDGLAREDIERELSKLPSEWPVTDEELGAVADFADYRRGPVGARLLAMVA